MSAVITADGRTRHGAGDGRRGAGPGFGRQHPSPPTVVSGWKPLPAVRLRAPLLPLRPGAVAPSAPACRALELADGVGDGEGGFAGIVFTRWRPPGDGVNALAWAAAAGTSNPPSPRRGELRRRRPPAGVRGLLGVGGGRAAGVAHPPLACVGSRLSVDGRSEARSRDQSSVNFRLATLRYAPTPSSNASNPAAASGNAGTG